MDFNKIENISDVDMVFDADSSYGIFRQTGETFDIKDYLDWAEKEGKIKRTKEYRKIYKLDENNNITEKEELVDVCIIKS